MGWLLDGDTPKISFLFYPPNHPMWNTFQSTKKKNEKQKFVVPTNHIKHIEYPIQSGQIIIFHQPRFSWNKGLSLTKPPPFGGNRSCEVAIIWPDPMSPSGTWLPPLSWSPTAWDARRAAIVPPPPRRTSLGSRPVVDGRGKAPAYQQEVAKSRY